jgi:hypothetical protein
MKYLSFLLEIPSKERKSKKKNSSFDKNCVCLKRRKRDMSQWQCSEYSPEKVSWCRSGGNQTPHVAGRTVVRPSMGWFASRSQSSSAHK